MAGGTTPLGDWLANTFTPAGKIARAMGNPPGAKGTPNAQSDITGLTPEELAERKRKLMAAGQHGNSFGNSVMSLFGLNQ